MSNEKLLLQSSCNPTSSSKASFKFARGLKRLLDVLLALFLMPIVCLVIAVAAIAIKLDSSGPVFYSGQRIGKNGREFPFFKLRTMHQNADVLLQKHLASSPDLQKQWENFAKIKGFDPRVTRVGTILRKLSVDELPQVANVILGDMSFIGPRPYLPREKQYLEGHEDILRVPPGISGFWQVSGRNNVTFDQRLRMDTWYVENWSLWLDLVILIRTISVVFGGKGAY
ncbi:sugar transferase [Metallumcola ferriviriculae]|uniref:Sugar transferase n=1 Tax=Metallumcola ferriviriculae TaxID=3039180 RepID=A0AAU0UMF4_9FIRM|nr:sugar transferase [Desulfitibacteraceae bacterium MK1]